MKRKWNLWVWAGFVVALAAALSYTLFFVRFPVTRDFPWANLLLFAVAGCLLSVGLIRAFRHPEAYRGKISGSIFLSLSLLLFGLFSYPVFYLARQLPASTGAPKVGEFAPDFTLPDSTGHAVTLSSLLNQPSGTTKTTGAVLIFYRGYW